MSEEGVVYLLMVLNVDTCVGVVLERSLRSGGGRVGVDESSLTVVGGVWTQINVYFL